MNSSFYTLNLINYNETQIKDTKLENKQMERLDEKGKSVFPVG
jgi:hypothetical protein